MYVSITCGLFAIVLGMYIILYLPHDREVKSLAIFLLNLLPFFLAAISISLLDYHFFQTHNIALIAIVCCFLLFFVVYVPRLFYELFVADGGGIYYNTLILVPIIILSLALSYRLGGGSTENTLRLSFSLLVIMLSGIEDLAFFIVNSHEPGRFNPIPEVWDWVSHMRVRIGHNPTKNEAYLFIAGHLVLAGFILFYPFRFITRLKRLNVVDKA